MKKQQWIAMAAGSFFAMSALPLTAFASTSAYVVQPGDSYFTIGRAHQQPFTVLQAINSTNSSSEIEPGQTIHLATRHVVKPGESVWKIAHAYDLSETDIIRWNYLTDPDLIYAGSTLWLDLSKSKEAPAKPATKKAASTHKEPVKTAAQTAAKTTAKVAPSATTTVKAAPAAPAAKPAVAPAPSVTGSEIVAYAKRYIGTPYVYGGDSPSGFDCSGFVQTVYNHFDVALPRTATEQHAAGTPVSKSALQPGDLVFFNTTGRAYSHVGIYIGDGQFISSTSSHGVRISSLDNPYYWGPRFTGAVHLYA